MTEHEFFTESVQDNIVDSERIRAEILSADTGRRRNASSTRCTGAHSTMPTSGASQYDHASCGTPSTTCTTALIPRSLSSWG